MLTCQSTQEPKIAPLLLARTFLLQEKGQYVTYAVEQIQYGINQSVEKQTYQLQYQLQSSEKQVSGEEKLIIVQRRRNTPQQNWQTEQLVQIMVYIDKVIQVEQNIPLYLLPSPLVVGQTWNYHQYNTLGKAIASLQAIKNTFVVNHQTFPQTAHVIQYQDSTALGQKSQLTVYAANIGMIFLKKTDVSYCYQPHCLGKAIIDFGSITTYQITDYGKE